MGFAAPVMAIGSTIFGGLGAIMQGEAQSQAAEYSAQVARNNQIVMEQNAKIALQQGEVAEEARQEKTGQIIGSERAQYSAMGVDPNSGSALDVRSSSAETGELDALTIRYNAQMQARNYMTQASSYGAQSGLYGAQAGWDTMNSILGGASSVSNKWAQYQMYGVPGFGTYSASNAGAGLGPGGWVNP